VFSVGDVVELRQPRRERQPYVGLVTRFFEGAEEPMVRVQWFYRERDLVTAQRDTLSNEIFLSQEQRDNPVCSLLTHCLMVWQKPGARPPGRRLPSFRATHAHPRSHARRPPPHTRKRTCLRAPLSLVMDTAGGGAAGTGARPGAGAHNKRESQAPSREATKTRGV
jgi:hypothetical protein